MSEFKNLPSGWQVVRLGEIGKVINGLTYSPDNVSNNGLLVLRSSNINNNSIVLNNDDVYVKGISKFNKTLENDILICVRNGSKNLIGKNALITGKYKDLAFGAFMAIFRSNYNLFLIHIFKTNTFFKQVKNDLGATINSINNSNLLNFKIPLPPLDEQEKIAEILSTWDEAINLTINLIENKKQFKKALMQNLLTAKTNWHTTILDNVGEIITGSTPSTTNEKFWDGEIAWITPTDIGDKKDIFIGERSITQDGLNATRELPANSLLVTCIASIGKNAILKVKGSCNQQINALVPNKNFNVDFLYYLLEFEKERLKNLAGITATLIISKALFSKFKISFPNIIEQQKIAEVLTACDDEINLLNLKLENLKKQKQGLMQKLLSGKVRARV